MLRSMSIQDRLNAALSEWRTYVGADHVVTSAEDLALYEANVSGLRRTILAVVKPGSAEEVRQVVAVANEHRIALYPVSSGKNWGLGSRLPVQDDAVIVDLSRMNRIREISLPYHYAVVEPGVTQRQLYEELGRRKLPLLVNVTGAAADTSLIGNALERGVGYFSSRADSLAGLEIVLGNGTLLRTGFGHYASARTSYLYRHGIGPSLDGLFFQSNFGIVTAAAVDLIPAAEHHLAVVARLKRAEQLPEFIDALVELRRRQVIRTVAHIGNWQRTRISMAPLIYREIARWMPGTPEQVRCTAERILTARGFGPWSVVTGVLGTAAQVREARREVRRTLQGIASIFFLTDRLLAMADRLSVGLAPIPWVRKQRALLKAVQLVYDLVKGIPTDVPMLSVYWPLNRMPDSPSDNPDLSDCGLLYCVPFLPAEGRLVREAMDRMERVFTQHGFTPFVTLNLVDSKSLECVINLAFDRTKPEQVSAAHACHDELTQDFIRQGYPPYRVGIQSMSLVVDAGSPYWQTVRELKRVFDPNNIIAPGRYNLP